MRYTATSSNSSLYRDLGVLHCIYVGSITYYVQPQAKCELVFILNFKKKVDAVNRNYLP